MQQDPRQQSMGQNPNQQGGFGQTQWTYVGGQSQQPQGYAQSPYGQMEQNPYQQQAAQMPPVYTAPPAYVPPTPPQGPRAVPATGIQGRKNPRKPVWVIFLGIFLTVLIVCGIAVMGVMGRGGQNYGYVTMSTLNASYHGDAVIVRNETLYTQEGASLIEQNVEEGAEVSRATNVCVVYTAGFNTRELSKLENYRDQIKEYHKNLLSASTTKDMRLDRLENEVLTQVREAQNLVQGISRGSLVEQEKTLRRAMQDRQVYLKQKYPDDQKLSRLYDDENTQQQKISSWTKQYAATSNGIVSFYTDGFENVLNLYNYADYSPVQVRAMVNGMAPQDESRTKNTVPVYRLVRQGQFVVLMLCDDPDWTPVEGRTYKLRIENFDTTIVDATVESFTRSGGELLVRLMVSGDINMGNIMYTRNCSVQLGESVDSLTVPARALHSQNGKTGVVMATESGAYWTPVTVIGTEGDSAHIIPENAGVLYEGIPVLLF